MPVFTETPTMTAVLPTRIGHEAFVLGGRQQLIALWRSTGVIFVDPHIQQAVWVSASLAQERLRSQRPGRVVPVVGTVVVYA